MPISYHGIVPLAAVVILLFAGVAQATTCASGFKDCDKNYGLNGCEINVHIDVNNCGDCGVKCTDQCGANTVPVCRSAKCEFSCKAPFLNCDGIWKNGCEVDGGSDVNNCGACGTKCVAPAWATAKCLNGKCEYTCKLGWKNCDGKWENGCETDVGKDANNCGNCGAMCSAAPNATPSCNNHKCENTCKPTFADCDKDWSNGCETCTTTDPNNCGACGTKCATYPNTVSSCSGGKCEYSCKPGFNNCDGDWTNGCEAACGSDVNNCGACGTKCSTYPNAVTNCNGGKCEYSCKPGFSNCDGDWTNGCEAACGSDVNNCGACSNMCKTYPNVISKCTDGECQYSCKPGFSNCDGDWTNGCEASCGSDTENCGACGIKCATYPNAVTKCNGGQCEYSCKPGFNNCDGDWTNGCEASCGSDVNNCGACGTKCAAYPNTVSTCNGGKCEYSCKPGFKNCDGDWTNGCEASCGSDVNNCGACGTKCMAYPNVVTQCNGGQCQYSCKPGFKNCDGDWTNGCEASCGSDTENCGGCGVKCKVLPNVWTQCKQGYCVYTCKPGFADCDNKWWTGCESTPGSDSNNCGRCGNRCPTPRYAGGEAKCTNGRCETQSCKRGWKWEGRKSCCVGGGWGW